MRTQIRSQLRFQAASIPILGMAEAAQAAPLQDALHAYGIQAWHIGRLWNFTLGLCALVFVAIVAACLFAVWRAPRAEAVTPPDLDSLARP